MEGRRRYTDTPTLQLGWSVIVLVILVLSQVVLGTGPVPGPIALLACVLGWFLGLVALGLRERRHWERLVAASSFDRDSSTGPADLQQIVRGRSVVVSTTVAGLLTQTQTEISTSVEGVDASFTIRIADRTTADGDGLTTGNDALDDRFAIRGRERNVARLLSADVQRALLDVETPGSVTVTGESVTFVVPFTRLTADELDGITEAVVTIAERVEQLGRDKQ